MSRRCARNKAVRSLRQQERVTTCGVVRTHCKVGCEVQQKCPDLQVCVAVHAGQRGAVHQPLLRPKLCCAACADKECEVRVNPSLPWRQPPGPLVCVWPRHRLCSVHRLLWATWVFCEVGTLLPC